jgi:hypothetical protein
MRRVPMRIRCFGAALLALAGCWSTQPNLKPPSHPEEYRLPPSDDARFSSYIEYPKDTLNQDTILKNNKNQPGMPGPGGVGRFGAGPSMGQ